MTEQTKISYWAYLKRFRPTGSMSMHSLARNVAILVLMLVFIWVRSEFFGEREGFLNAVASDSVLEFFGTFFWPWVMAVLIIFFGEALIRYWEQKPID